MPGWLKKAGSSRALRQAMDLNNRGQLTISGTTESTCLRSWQGPWHRLCTSNTQSYIPAKCLNINRSENCHMLKAMKAFAAHANYVCMYTLDHGYWMMSQLWSELVFDCALCYLTLLLQTVQTALQLVDLFCVDSYLLWTFLQLCSQLGNGHLQQNRNTRKIQYGTIQDSVLINDFLFILRLWKGRTHTKKKTLIVQQTSKIIKKSKD